MANSCCGGSAQKTQTATPGCGYCAPVTVELEQVQIDRSKLQGLDPCVEVVGYKANIRPGPLQQCEQEKSCKWCKWLPWGLLGLLVLGILLWAPWRGGAWSSASSAAAAVPTQQLAQAGGQPPVSVTGGNSAATVFVNMVPMAQAGGQPPAGKKPSAGKSAVPNGPCKAVVFDPNGSMNRFGVTLAVDGGNYVIDQINGGKSASPNDIKAAQAAQKEWVMVVVDGPEGPYAINQKGKEIPVTVDNSGRILVSASQISI
jgi:hypothetical protein